MISNLRHLTQLRYAAHFHPLDDEDVAFVIEAGAVRADELSGDEFVARLRAQGVVPVRRVRIAQMLDNKVSGTVY